VSSRLTTAIVGGSGYTGGELLRLLLAHPHVDVGQVTSERLDGQFVHFTHPNLRRRTTLKFVRSEAVEPVDVLFLCLPHGSAVKRIEEFTALADRIVDLSADFRLRRAEDYVRWYGAPHPCPERLRSFVYGLPELHRAEIRAAKHVSGVGCNATATTLAVWPLALAGLIDAARGIICEVKVGSSEGGAAASDASHHPERAGVMRSFAPTGHRHTAEVLQAFRLRGIDTEVHLSATAVDNVRGVLATAHVFTRPGVAERLGIGHGDDVEVGSNGIRLHGRAVVRAADSGAPVADALANLADDLRRDRLIDADEVARRVAVRSAGPLGLCFLPAFVLVGVTPTVIGAFSSLLG